LKLDRASKNDLKLAIKFTSIGQEILSALLRNKIFKGVGDEKSHYWGVASVWFFSFSICTEADYRAGNLKSQ